MMPNRRRRSAAEWADLIAQYRAGDESDNVFCHRHDLSPATFRKWKYRYSSSRSTPIRPPSPQRSGFIELKPAEPSPAATLCIRLDRGVSIDCPLTMAPSAIAQLIQALRDER